MYSKRPEWSHLIESTLSAMLDDVLGNNTSGNPLFGRFSSFPVTWSLIEESVAQRKTPMLDLLPNAHGGVLETCQFRG